MLDSPISYRQSLLIRHQIATNCNIDHYIITDRNLVTYSLPDAVVITNFHHVLRRPSNNFLNHSSRISRWLSSRRSRIRISATLVKTPANAARFGHGSPDIISIQGIRHIRLGELHNICVDSVSRNGSLWVAPTLAFICASWRCHVCHIAYGPKKDSGSGWIRGTLIVYSCDRFRGRSCSRFVSMIWSGSGSSWI